MTPDLRACSPYFRSPAMPDDYREVVPAERTRTALADKVMRNLLDRERKPARSERSSRRTPGGSGLERPGPPFSP